MLIQPKWYGLRLSPTQCGRHNGIMQTGAATSCITSNTATSFGTFDKHSRSEGVSLHACKLSVRCAYPGDHSCSTLTTLQWPYTRTATFNNGRLRAYHRTTVNRLNKFAKLSGYDSPNMADSSNPYKNVPSVVAPSSH